MQLVPDTISGIREVPVISLFVIFLKLSSILIFDGTLKTNYDRVRYFSISCL